MTRLEISLAILTVIGFVGSLPQFWGQSWKDVLYYAGRRVFSWDKIFNGIETIFEELVKSEFKPSVIVGVGRGGAIASGMLASLFTKEQLEDSSLLGNQLKIGTINTVYRLRPRTFFDQKSEVEEFLLTEPTLKFTKEDKVVLIVSQSFTGSTLKEAIRKVENQGVPKGYIITASVISYSVKQVGEKYTPQIIGMQGKLGWTVPWKDKDLNTDRKL